MFNLAISTKLVHYRVLHVDACSLALLGYHYRTLGFARDFSDAPWVREMAGGDGDTLRKVIAQAKQH